MERKPYGNYGLSNEIQPAWPNTTLQSPKAMLAAFVARPIVELKQRDKSKIESILAYGELAMKSSTFGLKLKSHR